MIPWIRQNPLRWISHVPTCSLRTLEWNKSPRGLYESTFTLIRWSRCSSNSSQENFHGKFYFLNEKLLLEMIEIFNVQALWECYLPSSLPLLAGGLTGESREQRECKRPDRSLVLPRSWKWKGLYLPRNSAQVDQIMCKNALNSSEHHFITMYHILNVGCIITGNIWGSSLALLVNVH